MASIVEGSSGRMMRAMRIGRSGREITEALEIASVFLWGGVIASAFSTGAGELIFSEAKLTDIVARKMQATRHKNALR